MLPANLDARLVCETARGALRVQALRGGNSREKIRSLVPGTSLTMLFRSKAEGAIRRPTCNGKVPQTRRPRTRSNEPSGIHYLTNQWLFSDLVVGVCGIEKQINGVVIIRRGRDGAVPFAPDVFVEFTDGCFLGRSNRGNNVVRSIYDEHKHAYL